MRNIDLKAELKKLEVVAPNLFYKPLEEMSASDKMGIASDLLAVLATNETEL